MKTRTLTVGTTKVAEETATKVATVKTEKKVSDYSAQVIEPHKAMKQDCKTLGYTIKLLKQFGHLPTSHLSILSTIEKESAAYELTAKECRKTKSGAFNAFYLRQYIYRLHKAEVTK